MQVKLKTLKLQEMVARAIKGASNNKMIPITSLMAIELKDNILTLTTTDATNYLKIIEKQVEGEDFYVVVAIEVFSKLIAKTTSEFITLTLQENSLQVRGNGTYSIDLPLDEEGKLIHFPEYKFNSKAKDLKKTIINLSTIKSILNVNKAALAETMEIPCYMGYYFGEQVVTTDTFKICCNDVHTLDKTVLLPGELVSLLSIMTDEKIVVEENAGKILFSTENCVVYGAELEGIEDFAIDDIMEFVNSEFESSCTLPKAALLAVLDRLMLFVTNYDKNGIYLTFTNEGLMLTSKKSTGTELVKYQGSENFKSFTCCADIQLLRSQIAAQEGEVVEMYYGSDRAIKMISGKVTQIVALLEDDRLSNGE